MADRPGPLEDALHVAVGAAILGYNRLQIERRRAEEWLDRLATELSDDGDRQAGAG